MGHDYEFDGFALQPGSAVCESLDAAGCCCHLPEHRAEPEDDHGSGY